MAKWGEGDPRWIVEERPDATNVNNWHWTEKNATAWSKERLQQLFNEFVIEQNDISCSINAVDKCVGEATANNRKGKLIFFYEWEIVLKWSGKLLKCSNMEHKGKITIPNLSEENDLEDVEVTVTIDESNDESEVIKQFMYNVGREEIRQQLGRYIKELKEEYSKNLILPKKDSNDATPVAVEKSKATNSPTANDAVLGNADAKAKANVNATLGCKLDVRTLNMTEEFQCSPNDLYNALTKVDMLTAFTRAPVKIDAIRGGEFSIYGGTVQGRFDELIPEKKISQTWRLKSWPSGHYSNVIIEIEERKNNTHLKLTQTGIPVSEFEAMKTNWNRYYWNSIKQTFGFGAALF